MFLAAASEDRYHAAAIESGKYFLNCLVYIDLNMVRAGIVEHSPEWGFGVSMKYEAHAGSQN